MASPWTARFPAGGLALLLALGVAGGCTDDPEPGPAGAPSSASPNPEIDAIPSEPSTEGPDDRTDQGDRVTIRDRGNKRTVRGSAPPYMEIESATVEGSIDELRLGVTLAERAPLKMPNEKSLLRVTFTVRTKDGRRLQFDAQCVRTGWGSFASGGTGEDYFPEVEVRGQQIDIVADPAFMGGLQPFEWVASVAWTRGETDYAFDSVPAGGFASYP